MQTLDVTIVRLEPMLCMSAYGFGSSPEEMAHSKMNAFLEARGLLEGYGSDECPSYGFNNPSPMVGSPNYGYEIWVPVAEGTQPQDDLRLQYFAGGLYAITRFTGLEYIGEVWQQLVAWREQSGYKTGYHQWLERLHNPLEKDYSRYTFDLYLPILE